MKRRTIAAIALGILISLTACNKDTETYVDVDPEKEVMEQEESFDDLRKNFPLGSSRITFDGNYLYIYGMKADVNKHVITYDCDIVGCKHNTEECGAWIKQQRSSERAYDGGFYYTLSNGIYYEKDDKQTLIYENDHTTEWSKETYDDPYGISMPIIVDDTKIIVFGANFLFTVNPKTKEATEPIDVGEIYFLSFSLINENKVAVANINFELFTVDLDSSESVKLKDYVLEVQSDGTSLYYISTENNKRRLIKCDVDGTNEEVIIENVGIYQLEEDSILFTQQDDNSTVYKKDLNTHTNEKLLELKNDKGEDWEALFFHYFPGYKNTFVDIYDSVKHTQEYVLIDPETKEYSYIESHQ